MFDIDRTHTIGRLSLDLSGGGWEMFTLGVGFNRWPFEYSLSLFLGILCISLLWERDWTPDVEANRAMMED